VRVATGVVLIAWATAAVPAAAQCGPGSYLAKVKARPVAESLLVSAPWLARHRTDPDLTILHVARSAAPYDSAHIPGARLVLLGEFTVDRDSILTELPPVETLVELLVSKGITNRGRIVLYGDLLGASRLWFTLDYLGLGNRAAILDGGLASWRGARLPLATKPPAPARRGVLTVHPRPEVVAQASWLKGHLADQKLVVLDARTPEEFRGEVAEDGIPRPGHIPGARNLDWTTTLEGGVFKSPATLRGMLAELGAPPGTELVALCRTGTRASLLYFIGRYLGYPTRLYDGSMNEWSRLPDLPIATGNESRIR